MKIYIHYQNTNRPWGGVNSFVKAFKSFCRKNNITLANSINEPFDILLITGSYKNRKDLLNVKELITVKRIGVTNQLFSFVLKRKPKLLIYRCDGFRDEYAGLFNDPSDVIQKECLNIADHIVFQNEFCLRSARRTYIGYNKDNFSIIYNGVDQNLFQFREKFWDGIRPMRFIAANWSKNLNKGYDLIAKFSELENIEVSFCGRWPEDIDCKKVIVLAPLVQTELAKEFKKHDVLLHPAKYDPSPNVCLEAISCGLPVIFHSTSGMKEVASDCGIEIDENNLQKTLTEIKTKYFSLMTAIKNKRDFYSIERCGREYIEVFEKLLLKR